MDFFKIGKHLFRRDGINYISQDDRAKITIYLNTGGSIQVSGFDADEIWNFMSKQSVDLLAPPEESKFEVGDNVKEIFKNI